MTFLHKSARGQLVMQAYDQKWIETAGGRSFPETIPGKRIVFEPLSQPIDWSNTSRFSDDNTELVFRGKYVTDDEEVIEFLVNNERYGRDFIAVSDDGRELVPSEWIIHKLPSGEARCRVCNRLFKNAAGAEGHTQSDEHKTNLARYREQELRKI